MRVRDFESREFVEGENRGGLSAVEGETWWIMQCRGWDGRVQHLGGQMMRLCNCTVSDGRYGRCRSMRSEVKRSYWRLNCSIDMFSVDEGGADSEDGVRADSAFIPGDSEGKAFFAAWVEDKKNMRYVPSLIDGLSNNMDTRFSFMLRATTPSITHHAKRCSQG